MITQTDLDGLENGVLAAVNGGYIQAETRHQAIADITNLFRKIRDKAPPAPEKEKPWEPDIHSVGYNEGLTIGLTWNGSWMPGGPWQFAADEYDGAKARAKAAESQENNRNWMAGFRKGCKNWRSL